MLASPTFNSRPPTFWVYINDIVCDIDCNTALYTDDMSLFIVVEDEYDWTYDNFWEIGTTLSPIHLYERLVSELQSHKHLGLFFHENVSCHSHVNKIIDKMIPRSIVFLAWKFKLKRKHFQTIYLSFYPTIIWIWRYYLGQYSRLSKW